MNTRKVTVICLILSLCSQLCACTSVPASESEDSGDKITICTTMFPAYDFARQIAGERAEVTLLVPPGTESHSYEPTPQDILLLGRCSLLVANGGENEAWLESIADSLERIPETVYMLDEVQALSEETVEGMQSGGILLRGDEHGHSHAHEEHEHDNEHEEGGQEHETEYDEHVWTSPQNAVLICEAIADRLSALDPGNAEIYRANCREYTSKLIALDDSFREVTQSAARHTLIFADRFPVRYFTEEYGLDYYAAFPGCADDAEPSARTVAFLIDMVRAEKVPYVFYIEFSNEKMADIIAEETGCGKLLFHSCHNVTAAQLESGVSYLELMTQNLENVKEALS